jgi:hypothetical protein
MAVVSDTFTRADSTSVIGSADTGQAWSQVSGTWGINSNRGYQSSGGSQDICVIDSGLTSVDMSCDETFDTQPDSGLVFAVADNSNYLLFATQPNAVDVKIYKQDTAVFTELATNTLSSYASTTKTLRVTFNASTGAINCYMAGVSVLTYTLTPGELTKYGANRNQGLRDNQGTVHPTYFDNYTVVDLFGASATVTDPLGMAGWLGG